MVKKIKLLKKCPDCKEGKEVRFPVCHVCGGAQRLMNHKTGMPVPCINKCWAGRVRTLQVCRRCNGTNWI